MPKIIVTSTFRKGGKGGKNGGAGGLLKHMGTRERVEKLPLGKDKWKVFPVSIEELYIHSDRVAGVPLLPG